MGSNTATGNSELRHGYTLASLDGLAPNAVLESHWRFLSFRDRYDIAFGAIAEHLYASDETPRPHDLKRKIIDRQRRPLALGNSVRLDHRA